MKPEVEATRVLQNTWGNNGFPVDPVSIAKKLGIDVVETSLPESVSGALIKKTGKDPLIAIDSNDSINRRRFSCAHELGHYISRAEKNNFESEYEFVDLRSDSSSNGINPEEIFANKFAANLLMPEAETRKIYKSKKSHFEMAYYFGVSDGALKFRLTNLSII